MQKPFQPSPDAQVAIIDLEPMECQALQLEAIAFVTRMVKIDDVHLDFATNRLSVSFYFPCSEDAIRRRLSVAGFAIKEQEAPALALEEGTLREAVPA